MGSMGDGYIDREEKGVLLLLWAVHPQPVPLSLQVEFTLLLFRRATQSCPLKATKPKGKRQKKLSI